MQRDFWTSMQYCISPSYWSNLNTKWLSMFQRISLKEESPFSIQGRGVTIIKELISEAFHAIFVAEIAAVTGTLHQIVEYIDLSRWHLLVEPVKVVALITTNQISSLA